MVFAEISYLAERKKIDLTREAAISYVNEHDNVYTQAMDIEVIKNAFEIDDIPELHDRLIAGSGKLLGYPIITNDPKIIASKFVSTIWE